jgi:hypothetical protein
MKGTLLAALGYAIMLSFCYAVVMTIFPVLQHWLLYILLGPALGIFFGWVYSGVAKRDDSPGNLWSISFGMAATLTHTAVVTVVWLCIKNGLVAL